MHIADCIELYLAHDVHGAFTKELEQTQESQLSAEDSSEEVLKKKSSERLKKLRKRTGKKH
jgi:hypothetical protein